MKYQLKLPMRSCIFDSLSLSAGPWLANCLKVLKEISFLSISNFFLSLDMNMVYGRPEFSIAGIAYVSPTELLCVQEVVTPFYIVTYYIQWSNYFQDTRYIHLLLLTITVRLTHILSVGQGDGFLNSSRLIAIFRSLQQVRTTQDSIER